MVLLEHIRQRWSSARAPARDDAGWSGTLVLLPLPRKSASLHFRAYAETLEGESVLHWIVRRLAIATPGASAIVVIADDAEQPRVVAALGSDLPYASVWTMSGRGDLEDVAALCEARAATRVLLADPTAALLPADLFARVRDVHAAEHADATYLAESPCVQPPLIVEASLVRQLRKVTREPADLRAILGGMRRSPSNGAGGGLRGARFRQTKAPAADPAGHAGPGQCAGPGDRAWPYAVSLDSPKDIEVLSAVRRRVNGAEPGRGLLADWTEVLQSAPPTASRPSLTARNGTNTRSVLFVSAASAFTGAEQSLVILAGGLQQSHKLGALIGQAGLFADRLTAAGIDVQLAQRDFAVNSVDNFLYATSVLEARRPSIVHANSASGVPLACAAARFGIPFVQHVRLSTVLPLAGQVQSATAVIAVSHFTKRCLIRFGVDARKIHVVHNGMPTNFMTDDARAAGRRLRQTCGIPDNARVVLMVARFAPNKRHDVAVQAMAHLARAGSGRLVHLLIAGETFREDQPVLDRVTQQVDMLGLASRVHFLGFRDDMAAVYSAADALVLPSEDDPFPRAILEAMAGGIPVIASDSGGNPELVTQRETGLLVKPGDASAFALAIAEVFSNDTWRAELVRAAAERCARDFSVSRYVEGVRRVYDQVVA